MAKWVVSITCQEVDAYYGAAYLRLQSFVFFPISPPSQSFKGSLSAVVFSAAALAHDKYGRQLLQLSSACLKLNFL